jgi:hypothetical protein
VRDKHDKAQLDLRKTQTELDKYKQASNPPQGQLRAHPIQYVLLIALPNASTHPSLPFL